MKHFLREGIWLNKYLKDLLPSDQGGNTSFLASFLGLILFLFYSCFKGFCSFLCLCLRFHRTSPQERLAKVLESLCHDISDLWPKNPRLSVPQHGVALKPHPRSLDWFTLTCGPPAPVPNSTACRHPKVEEVGLVWVGTSVRCIWPGASTCSSVSSSPFLSFCPQRPMLF